MFNVVSTALAVNNTCSLTTIPFSYLTRIEKQNEPLISLSILNQSSIVSQNNYFYPFQNEHQNAPLYTSYQPLCQYHVKSILNSQDQSIIYISMSHHKNNYKDFFANQYGCQFHYILQLISYDEQLVVKPVIINDLNIFLKHQEKAREYEKKFNLIHHIKNYIDCPYCVPTLASTCLFYKQNDKIISKKSLVDDSFKKAFTLIKDDRIDLNLLFNLTQIKWKSNDYTQYVNKINLIGDKMEWNFYNIINYIHKLHYNTIKYYERWQDKKNNQNSWHDTKMAKNEASCKTNSPSWRSTIHV